VRLAANGDAVRGVIFDGRELLGIEPAGGGGIVVFRLDDWQFDAPISMERDAIEAPVIDLNPASAPGAQALTADRKLEISAVGDAAFRARYASDADTRDAVLTRLNIVDGFFSAQVGVSIQLASFDLAQNLGASLDESTDSSLLLDSLGRLRQQTPVLNSRGLTHLFTGRDLDGDNVGIAYSGSLCSARYSASLAEAHDSAAVDGLITAHEIAHAFGAPHDGDGACSATSSTQFIMAPVLNMRATSFSPCSLEQMAPRAANASCLLAVTPADLALPSSLGSHDVAIGADSEWSFEVSNRGQSAANAVRVTVEITPALTVVSAGMDGGTCVVQSSLATCDVSNIPARASSELRVVLRSATAGTFDVEGQIIAGDDGDRANDTSHGTLRVSGASPTPPGDPTPAPGSGGGGSLDVWLLALIATLAGAARRRRDGSRSADDCVSRRATVR
jgi:hypothetical protein